MESKIKNGRYFSSVIWGVTLFILMTRGTFQYTKVAHWMVALVMAILLVGFFVLVRKIVECGRKQFSEPIGEILERPFFQALHEYYINFNKRPMNVETIAIVAISTVIVVSMLFVVIRLLFYPLLAWAELGTFLFNTF